MTTEVYQDRVRRRESFRSLSQSTKLLHESVRDALASHANALAESVRAALDVPPDGSIPGWRIVRIPVSQFNVELTICESTAVNVPFTLQPHQTDNVVLTVKRGRLGVKYDGSDDVIDISPDSPPLILPAGIGRTTFVSEHPCTVFCVLFGGSGRGIPMDS